MVRRLLDVQKTRGSIPRGPTHFVRGPTFCAAAQNLSRCALDPRGPIFLIHISQSKEKIKEERKNYVLVCMSTDAGFLKTLPSFMPTRMPIFLFSARSASLCVMIPSKTME